MKRKGRSKSKATPDSSKAVLPLQKSSGASTITIPTPTTVGTEENVIDYSGSMQYQTPMQPPLPNYQNQTKYSTNQDFQTLNSNKPILKQQRNDLSYRAPTSYQNTALQTQSQAQLTGIYTSTSKTAGLGVSEKNKSNEDLIIHKE